MSGQKHTGDIPPPVTAEKFLRTGSTEKKELQLDLKGIFFTMAETRRLDPW